MRRVVVTGLGVVSPIAIGKENYWQALREGKNGIGQMNTFDVSDCPVPFGAEVKDFDPAQWMDNKEAKRADRVIQFAVAAADIAVTDAKLDTKSLDPYNSEYTSEAAGRYRTQPSIISNHDGEGAKRVSPFLRFHDDQQHVTAYVANQHQAKGPNMCVVTACAPLFTAWEESVSYNNPGRR